MTDEEASEQTDRTSAALRDTILQLNYDGLDSQCIVEALIVQAVGLAFAEYGRAEGQYLVEGTMNACLREAATNRSPRRANALTTPTLAAPPQDSGRRNRRRYPAEPRTPWIRRSRIFRSWSKVGLHGQTPRAID